MKNMCKPKIGLLGLITDGYEDVFPGILKRQEDYARELQKTLNPVADIVFHGAAVNPPSIERIVCEYNYAGLDGILIVLLAYSQGAWLVRAMKENRLPVAVAVVQPDQEVLSDWGELELTVNQGIHGAQDNCNVLHRLNIKYQVFAGNRNEQRFLDFVEVFGKAAQAASALRRMRTAVFSRMQGMGDVLTDDLAFFSKVGPEFCHDTIGSVYSQMIAVSEKEVAEQIEADYERFEVDPKLTPESHSEAVRIYLGFRRYLKMHGYDAFTAHFDQFKSDGRFRQLPLYAASRLLAEGYGYAAEGDSVCASMVAAAHHLGRFDANFTEMYMLDFAKQAIIFCHAGESNWATHCEGIKPRLVDRFLGEGGLENPPTILFPMKTGPATISSLVSMGGHRFRLITALGVILPQADLKRCEMPYFFWRPDSSMETCVEGWLNAGGTHHEVINLGDLRARWKILCGILDIEYVEL